MLANVLTALLKDTAPCPTDSSTKVTTCKHIHVGLLAAAVRMLTALALVHKCWILPESSVSADVHPNLYVQFHAHVSVSFSTDDDTMGCQL